MFRAAVWGQSQTPENEKTATGVLPLQQLTAHANCKEHKLFEVGRSDLGNPGVVVGSEARFLLQGVNLALDCGELVVGKRRDRCDLLANGLHGTRDLLFRVTG